MATPAFAIQSISLQLPLGVGNSYRTTFIATDLAGAAVNVSSGYTAQLIAIVALRNLSNSTNGPETDISSATTFGFASDGTVTMTIDGDAVKDMLLSSQGDCYLQLSNDSGSTWSTAASGSYQSTRVSD